MQSISAVGHADACVLLWHRQQRYSLLAGPATTAQDELRNARVSATVQWLDVIVAIAATGAKRLVRGLRRDQKCERWPRL